MYSIPKQAPQAPRVLTRAGGKTRQNDAFPAILDDVAISAHTHSKRSDQPHRGASRRSRSGRAGRKTDFRTALKMARTEVELGPWLREFLEAPTDRKVSSASSAIHADTADAKSEAITDHLLPVSVAVPNSPIATGPQMSLQMPLPAEFSLALNQGNAGLAEVGLAR